jgi:hypothetical protein
MVGAPGESDLVEQPARSGRRAPALAAELDRQLHVLGSRQERDQVGALQHDPDPARAQPGPRGVIEVAQRLAVKEHRARVGMHQAGEQRHERRLAAARHADQARRLAALELEARTAQDMRLESCLAIGLRDRLYP